LNKILTVLKFQLDKNFNFNSGDPSLSLRMTGFWDQRGKRNGDLQAKS